MTPTLTVIIEAQCYELQQVFLKKHEILFSSHQGFVLEYSSVEASSFVTAESNK